MEEIVSFQVEVGRLRNELAVARRQADSHSKRIQGLVADLGDARDAMATLAAAASEMLLYGEHDEDCPEPGEPCMLHEVSLETRETALREAIRLARDLIPDFEALHPALRKAEPDQPVPAPPIAGYRGRGRNRPRP